MNTEQDSGSEPCAPDYSVHVEADELLADLAEKAAQSAREHAYHARCWRDDDWWQYRQWMQEERKKMTAYATAIAMLQPERYCYTVPRGEFVADDRTVNVREFMRATSSLGDDAHDRDSRPAESAYARVLSLLRDEYGVGWPRFDDLGGVLEADLP